jgi:hypothetical protein
MAQEDNRRKRKTLQKPPDSCGASRPRPMLQSGKADGPKRVPFAGPNSDRRESRALLTIFPRVNFSSMFLFSSPSRSYEQLPVVQDQLLSTLCDPH